MLIKDKLNIDTKRKYTAEGFLVVPARISRTGLQQYLAGEIQENAEDPNKKIMVYRPPEEVFSEDSINSFKNKIITNNHPKSLVDATNAKKLGVGHSSNDVTKDGKYLNTELTITDCVAIKDVENGKVEISNGYLSDFDFTSGETEDGEKYDAIQKNIRGNHIAIVHQGRAGRQCKIADNNTTGGNKMAVVAIDGVDYEMVEQIAQLVSKLQAQIAEGEGKIGDMAEEMKAMEPKEKSEKLQAEVDDMKEKMATADSIDVKIEKRIALMDSVKALVDDIEFKGKSDTQIISDAVSKLCPNLNVEDKSSEYLQARFDLLLEQKEDGASSVLDAAFAKQMGQKETKDDRPESVIAREKMIKDNANRWRKK